MELQHGGVPDGQTKGNVALMSLIRALSKELQARSDDSLRALFSARPDLISPGVPDFAALAARASGRVSVQRALERLNRPEMQVLETLHLCTNTDTGHSASAPMLKKLINGATLVSIEKMLHSLQELALVHRAEPPHGAVPVAGTKLRYYLPVGSLKDVMAKLPDYLKNDPAVELLCKAAKESTVTVVHLIYRSKNYESSSKDYDFSHIGMVEHWGAGERDVHLSMRHKDWLERPQSRRCGWSALSAT